MCVLLFYLLSREVIAFFAAGSELHTTNRSIASLSSSIYISYRTDWYGVRTTVPSNTRHQIQHHGWRMSPEPRNPEDRSVVPNLPSVKLVYAVRARARRRRTVSEVIQRWLCSKHRGYIMAISGLSNSLHSTNILLQLGYGAYGVYEGDDLIVSGAGANYKYYYWRIVNRKFIVRLAIFIWHTVQGRLGYTRITIISLQLAVSVARKSCWH